VCMCAVARYCDQAIPSKNNNKAPDQPQRCCSFTVHTRNKQQSRERLNKAETNSKEPDVQP
jgi:hypothetical protein